MYTIYIFKNNKKKKKLKSFVREKLAIDYFNSLVKKSSEIKFNKQFENGYECKFHIGIISDKYTSDKIYVIDEFGRNRIIDPKIDESNYIVKMSEYKIEDLLYDVSKDKKISIDNFLKTEIKSDKIYMVSKINNKFVLQENDDYKLFSLKNEIDCDRFLDKLVEFCEKKNIIVVKDISSAQRKYLYNLLTEKGFDRRFIYTSYTTYPR